jgi:hypothetical protein
VRPDYRDAHAHYQAKETGTGTGDYVPAERVNALHGLTVPRQPGTGEQ